MLCCSGVKGPKKMFPDLPFGSPDNEKVEARKSQLDVFLKVPFRPVATTFTIK